MVNVVYGVSGEGSGHATRSKFILHHLLERGHKVKVVTYDRGYALLKDEFDCFETEGLHISVEDNEVSKRKTVIENLKKLPHGRRRLQTLQKEVYDGFEPDCVITDFEPMTAWLASRYDLPLITIDNQHAMRYMKYPCPEYLSKQRRLTEMVIRAMVPKPDVCLVTSFYHGKPTNDRTFLFPPILREEFYDLKPVTEDFILVYLTRGFESFTEKLKQFRRERFVIYGCDMTGEYGPLHYKPFSATEFPRDLAACKAVMATAGFSLITESLYLHKPFLAVPMAGQFEQEINAYLLQRLSYGKAVREIHSDAIGAFLYHLPDYRAHLQGYKAIQQVSLTAKLDQLLAHRCAEARDFRIRRQSGENGAESELDVDPTVASSSS